MPKVSVVVTTYNRKDLLETTLRAITSQTYSDFEVVVVDNFSNYDFPGLIRSVGDERLTAYQHANGGIIAVNRNYGIQRAVGEYLAFCDDDDIWIPEKLEIQMSELDKGNVDLVSSNVLFFEGTQSHIVGRSRNRTPKSAVDLLRKNQINTSSVVVRNGSEVRFREGREFIAVEDYDLWLRLAFGGARYRVIEEPLVFYRLGAQNASDESWAGKDLRLIHIFSSILLSHGSRVNKWYLLARMGWHALKYLVKSEWSSFIQQPPNSHG